MKYGQFTALNIPKCEHFTHLVCPLRFLVISAIRRLGNVQSFKTYVFRFCYESDPGYAGYPTLGHLNICRISYDKRVIELISVYQRGKNYKKAQDNPENCRWNPLETMLDGLMNRSGADGFWRL